MTIDKIAMSKGYEEMAEINLLLANDTDYYNAEHIACLTYESLLGGIK